MVIITKCTVVVAGLLYYSNHCNKSQGAVAMKDKKKVSELLAALKAEFDTPFEIATVEDFERKLNGDLPRVKIINENMQEFLGIEFKKAANDGRFYKNFSISQFVWAYFNNGIPKGHEIHHKVNGKLDNNIENLVCLTIEEHKEHHKVECNCTNCGKYLGFKIEYANNKTHNHFCSQKCNKEWHKKYPTMIQRKCVICGIEFSAKLRGKETAITCSHSCSTKLGAMRRLSKIK